MAYREQIDYSAQPLPQGSVMCWDFCKDCGLSQSVFFAGSLNEFISRSANLASNAFQCIRCHSFSLESYHEMSELFVSTCEIDIMNGEWCPEFPPSTSEIAPSVGISELAKVLSANSLMDLNEMAEEKEIEDEEGNLITEKNVVHFSPSIHKRVAKKSIKSLNGFPKQQDPNSLMKKSNSETDDDFLQLIGGSGEEKPVEKQAKFYLKPSQKLTKVIKSIESATLDSPIAPKRKSQRRSAELNMPYSSNSLFVPLPANPIPDFGVKTDDGNYAVWVEDIKRLLIKDYGFKMNVDEEYYSSLYKKGLISGAAAHWIYHAFKEEKRYDR